MDGFSDDNYITDQDYFGNYSYRTIPSKRNGCGWIAAYNIRHYLNHKIAFEEVLHEMDLMHVQRIPGPTTMDVMRRYLLKYIPDISEFSGRNDCLKAAMNCNAAVLRYNEGGIPHFITFIKTDTSYRYFNVDDNFEDFEDDIGPFFDKHVKPFSYVAIFTI